MTAAQEELAVGLLREALDWVGLDQLTEREEAKATDLQLRIDRLLADVQQPARGETSVEGLYFQVCVSRDRLDRAQREMAESRGHEQRYPIAVRMWQRARDAYLCANREYESALVAGSHQCHGR